MSRLNIHAKLLVSFVIVLLPVMGLLFADSLSDLRRTQETILEAQFMTAQAVAVQVSETFDSAISLGWVVSKDPLVQTLDPRRLDSHLKELLERSPLYDSIDVFDITGINRGWGNPIDPAEPRLNIQDRLYFQQALATNAPILSDVIELRRPKRPGLLVCTPIRGSDGHPLGVVNVVMRTDLLEQRYLPARLQPGQAIFLADQNGRLAFYTGNPSLSYEESNAFTSFAPLQSALTGTPVKLAQFKSPLSGDERLGAFVPVPNYPWVVGVTAPLDIAMAPLHERSRVKFAACTGILLLNILLAAGLARLFTRPVRQLQVAAQALGRGGMGQRVHIDTGDELEELGTAFNEMVAQVTQRQAEVDALRTEAERQAHQLAAVIASVPDAILLASADGRLIDANPAGLRLLGLEDHSELGESLLEYLQRYDIRHPDGQPMKPEELPIRRALNGETFTDVEMRMRGLDGQEHLLSVNGAPVRDSPGQIILGEIVIRDITRRRREEEALRRSEQSLAQAQRIAHLGNWTWDLALNQLHWSEEVYRIFGLTSGEFGATYEAFLVFVHPEDREPVQRAVDNTLEGSRPYSIDHRIIRPDGTERIVHGEAELLRDAAGRPVRLVGTVQDITERKQVEEELARMLDRELALARIGQALVSEVELERIADVAIEQSLRALGADAIGLWLAEPERQELTLIASHHLTTAVTESLRHLSFDEPLLTARAARTERIQVVEDTLEGGTPLRSRQLAREEGFRGLVAIPLHSRERLVGVMAYFTRAPRHFTSRELEFHATVGRLFAVAIEKARLFQEVRAALRLREEFMSAAAHELKTPVTTIQTWAEILLSLETVTPRQQKGLTTIARNTRRIARLVEHLFAAFRIAPSPPKLERKPFDLHALLVERVEKLTQTTDNPILIESTGPLFVHAERQLLGEVVVHLLENALRYSPPGRPVEILARRMDSEALVTVHDHGPGIPLERQPHVFEPLYEPLPPGAPGYTGVVDLGLHLSRQIVEAHGGRIWLVSPPGKGSTFCFSIPLGFAQAETAAPVYSSHGGAHPSR